MASGDTLITLFPRDAEPPTSNAATADLRAQIAVLDFDAATDESVQFPIFMPRHYDGGGATATIGFMATTATTGNVVLTLAWKSISDDADDVDTKAFATAQTVTKATATASGEVAYATIAFTDGAQIDSIAAGEYGRLQFTRDADNASDTMSGDAELVFIEIRET